MDKSLKIALILTAVDKASAVFGKAFAFAEKGTKHLKGAGEAIGNMGDKSLIAGGVMTAFFGKTVSDARESAIATARLDQVFKSMGDTTGKAAEQSAEYASALQFQIGVEDEAIMAVQAKLATFRRASDEVARNSGVFNRATEAAFDLQAAGVGDALGNITALGKALNNPALGAAALKKAGTINAEDLPAVKYIQKMKGIPAAQKYLLDAIERQVKGVAARTADPIKKMEIQFSESSEAIGKALLPQVNKLAASMAEYAPKIVDFVEKHEGLILVVAKAGVGLLAFGTAMKVLTPLGSVLSATYGLAGKALLHFGKTTSVVNKLMMTTGILLVIAAIAAGAYLIYTNWDKIKAFFVNLWANVTAAFSKAWEGIKSIFVNYTAPGLVYKHWDKITAWFTNLWSKLKAVFSVGWTALKYVLLNYTPHGLLFKHWGKIHSFFTGLWANVKTIFLGHVKWVMGLGGRFLEAGKNIVDSLWKGMKSMAHKPIEMIENIAKKIREFLPFSPAKMGPLKDIHKIKLVETVAQSIKAKPMTDAWTKATGGLRGAIGGGMQAVGVGGGGSTIHFSPVINLYGPATDADGERISSSLRDEFNKLMRQYKLDKSRKEF